MTNELTPEWTDADDAAEWTAADFARSEIRIGGKIIRHARVRDELTLREKVLRDMTQLLEDGFPLVVAVECLCLQLEGSPAHMRVAKELRGE